MRPRPAPASGRNRRQVTPTLGPASGVLPDVLRQRLKNQNIGLVRLLSIKRYRSHVQTEDNSPADHHDDGDKQKRQPPVVHLLDHAASLPLSPVGLNAKHPNTQP